MDGQRPFGAPRALDGIRAGKHFFRAAYLVVWVFILLVVAAPILGALTPEVAPQQRELGLGANLQTIQPQLQRILSSGGSGAVVSVPVFNNWFFPGTVALSLRLDVNGAVLYQTQRSNLTLAPFRSGDVRLPVDIPASTLQQMAGRSVAGGGEMTLDEGGLWTVTVQLGAG